MTSSQRPFAVFRCDASPLIGSGHVMRCLTLATELTNNGWRCAFLTKSETIEMIPAFNSKKFDVLDPIIPPAHADILIIDHYDLSTDYEKECRSWADKVMVIDDLANRVHECDILLDQTYGRRPEDYQEFTPKRCQLLCGSDYTLLRPQFITARKLAIHQREKKERINNVLVSFGASNPSNIIQTVLSAVSTFKEWPLTINIAMSEKEPSAENVKQLSNKINDNSIHPTCLYFDVENMAELMLNSDLSFGGGGSMSWERACLGLPTLMIELSDDQHLIAHTLHDLGATQFLGKLGKIHKSDIDKAFQNMRNDTALLVEMSQKSFAICDGLGTSRVYNKISAVTGKNN